MKVPEIPAKDKKMKIGLLGASFDTGNLGVNALAESSIKCILHRWPAAEVVIIGGGRTKETVSQKIGSMEITVSKEPVRFCKNIFVENHFLVLFFYALLFKFIRFSRFRDYCCRHNSALRNIEEIEFVGDISGGDSFSDIYGMDRFMLNFLVKWLMLFCGKDMVMLPQTYGPFKRPAARFMAAYILRKAKKIYSRDQDGVDLVNRLLKGKDTDKVVLCPDVAFVLDSRKASKIDIGGLGNAKNDDSVIVGLNVSGLLYNGGYTQNNMFGLKVDYPQLIDRLIEMLMADEKNLVLLVPHVFANEDYMVESDPAACRKIYDSLSSKWPDRLFMAGGEYDQAEIKYIIGMCDFFIGSRMHSCIAAVSQKIPAIGLAYSKKFRGVFDTINIPHFVVDACSSSVQEVLRQIELKMKQKDQVRQQLEITVSGVQATIANIFSDYSRC